MSKKAVLLLLASLACTCSAQQTSMASAQSGGSPATAPAITTPVQTALTTFVGKALLAFTPTGAAPTITLNGTVDRTIGSLKESGSVTVSSNSIGLETEKWTLSSGERDFSKTAFTGIRSCSIQVAGKDITAQADPGCSRIVPWFAPWSALSEIGAQAASASIVSTTADTSAGLIRLRFMPSYGDLSTVSTKGLKAIATLMQDSAVDVLFDVTTNLAQRVEYRQQSNGDPASAIAIAAIFSEYRLDSGFMLPHRIKRYVQRTLEADIRITNITTE